MRSIFVIALAGLLLAAPGLGWLFQDSDFNTNFDDIVSTHGGVVMKTVTQGNGETRQSVTQYRPDGSVKTTDRYRPDAQAPWQQASCDGPSPCRTSAALSSDTTPATTVRRGVCGRCGRSAAGCCPDRTLGHPVTSTESAAAPAPPSASCQRLKQQLQNELRARHAAHEGRQTAAAADEQPLANAKVGTPVAAYWDVQPSARGWYPGVISALHEDGTFGVAFDDGDELEVVPRDRIRTLNQDEPPLNRDQRRGARDAERAEPERLSKANEEPDDAGDEEEPQRNEGNEEPDHTGDEEETKDETAPSDKAASEEETASDEESPEEEAPEPPHDDDNDDEDDDQTADLERGEVASAAEVDYDRLAQETILHARHDPKGERAEWATREGWGRREAVRHTNARRLVEIRAAKARLERELAAEEAARKAAVAKAEARAREEAAEREAAAAQERDARAELAASQAELAALTQGLQDARDKVQAATRLRDQAQHRLRAAAGGRAA